MFEKVLVPHAGSHAGDRALEYAAKIAKDNNAKLTILHVVEDIPTPPLLAINFPGQNVADDIKSAKDELGTAMHEMLDAKAKSLQKQGIAASAEILQGDPDEVIARIIHDEGYELVVMAKRKKLPGIKGILKLGSTSRKVLEKISCPILLIDGEEE